MKISRFFRFSAVVFDRLNQFFEEVDRWLFKAVTGVLPYRELVNHGASPEEFKKRDQVISDVIDGHSKVRNGFIKTSEERAISVFDVIDQKASAVFTHISIMIASATVYLSQEDASFRVGAVVVLFIFIILAFLSLRLLRFWSFEFPPPADEGHDFDAKMKLINSFREEVFFRSILYRLVLNSASVMTIVSALILLVSCVESFIWPTDKS